MENYSHPDIPDILNQEGNSLCVDCGAEKPKWASMNNGVFLCLKCAGIHRGFGMSVSLIRSLQIDSWTERQLLYLTKGGNKNFKNNLSEFNIAETATLDIKYKSKAADYYRKYLKNEVDRESDSNYVPVQIVKPDMDVAMDIIEVKEEENEDKKEKPQEKEKKITKRFFGFMSGVLNKVKVGTSDAAKKVGKGFSDMKLGEKFKVAGQKIAGAAKTSGHFIADTTKKAATSIATKTKKAFKKGGKEDSTTKNEEGNNNGEEKKEENIEEKKEDEKKDEEKKEDENKGEEKKEEVNKEEEKKEEEKKEENNEVKEDKNEVPEEKKENTEEKKDDNPPSA